MQTTTKITFVGFLLAVSTLSVSDAKASPKIQNNVKTSGSIEYRLSRITKNMEQRNVETSNPLNVESGEGKNTISRGFGNGGRGGFANGYRGGFTNRSGGGGFANRGGGGGFANGGGGGFVNRSPWRNGGSFFNR